MLYLTLIYFKAYLPFFYPYSFVRSSGVLSTNTAYDYLREFNTIQECTTFSRSLTKILSKTTVNPNISGEQHC